VKLTDDVKQRKQRHFKQYRTAKQKLTNKENLVMFLHRGKPEFLLNEELHVLNISLTDFANILSTSVIYYYKLILKFSLWGYTVSFRVDWGQKVDLRLARAINVRIFTTTSRGFTDILYPQHSLTA